MDKWVDEYACCWGVEFLEIVFLENEALGGNFYFHLVRTNVMASVKKEIPETVLCGPANRVN